MESILDIYFYVPQGSTFLLIQNIMTKNFEISILEWGLVMVSENAGITIENKNLGHRSNLTELGTWSFGALKKNSIPAEWCCMAFNKTSVVIGGSTIAETVVPINTYIGTNSIQCDRIFRCLKTCVEGGVEILLPPGVMQLPRMATTDIIFQININREASKFYTYLTVKSETMQLQTYKWIFPMQKWNPEDSTEIMICNMSTARYVELCTLFSGAVSYLGRMENNTWYIRSVDNIEKFTLV